MSISKAAATLRNSLLGALALCLTLVASASLGASAQAAFTHVDTGQSFGPQGTGAGTFARTAGVTVDQSTGDVLVYDIEDGGSVYKFNASGEPVSFTSSGTNVITGVGSTGSAENELAVDSSSGPDAGDIYVADARGVRIYAASGAPLGELTGGEMCGVAVDSSGSVYVGIYPETVKKYTPAKNPVTNGDETSSMAGLHQICNVAVDGEGNLYAATYSGGITRYAVAQFGSQAATGTAIGNSGYTLAVDPGTNDLYVNNDSEIQEYDAAGDPIGASAQSGSLTDGVGVKTGGERLYAAVEGRVRIFGAPAVVPDVAGEQPSLSGTAVTLKGSVNPDGLPVTSCRFEYGSEAEAGYSVSAPCSPAPGAGSSPVAVSAVVSGLPSDTVYRYRLVVGNANGTNRTEAEYLTTPGPGLVNEAVAKVGTYDATLTGLAYPNGAATTAIVEYGPTASYGSSTAALDAGSGIAAAQIEVPLEGLQPGTTYHARVVLSNSGGTVAGGDLSFTTYAVAELGLPDRRTYEKVSPNDNADFNVYNNGPSELDFLGFSTDLPFQAAADGDALAYTGGPAEKGGVGIQGVDAGDQYVATRGPGGGWSAHNITPYSDSIADYPDYVGFSKDLTTGFLMDPDRQPLVDGAPSGGFRVPYENTLASESFQPFFTVTPPNRSIEEFRVKYAGSSSDSKHVVFEANDTFTGNAVDGGSEQYNLYDDREGSLSLVNVLPDGSPEPDATFGGPGLVDIEDFSSLDPPDFANVISEDGRRIFWTAIGTHDLYMREDDQRTVQVDAAVGGGGQFRTAAPDGSKVLFTKNGDLYEYDVETAQTSDLTHEGDVQSVVGASSNLSYVYFIAGGALASGAEAQTCEESECNLYVSGPDRSIRFISKLSWKDRYANPERPFAETGGVWVDDLGEKEAAVTPDGQHLVFGSVMSLAGHQTGGLEEIYVYDYDSAHLTCASCDPTGSTVSPYQGIGAYLPVSHMSTYLPRWMSEDGSRVFFDSVQALVPQDTNGENDVYEWERDGSGSCAKSAGCVYLLSGGTSKEGSFLIDASTSGDDVFIGTRERLLSEDQNEELDIYDARADAPPVPAAPQCTGTGCQGVPSAPPVFSTPASVTYEGVGNFPVAPKPAAKAKRPKAKRKAKRKSKQRRKHARSKQTRKQRSAKSKHDAHKAAAAYESDRRSK
jgi:hypothetical protein